MLGRLAQRLPTVLLAAMVLAGTTLSLAPPPARAATFSDISTSPFRVSIEWMVDQGLTGGCGDGRFCPRAPVTRGEMATFLVRMFGFTAVPATDPFSDDNSSIHEWAIDRLYASGIASGCAAGRFCPGGVVNRGQMATFLKRALGLQYGAGSDHFADDDTSIYEDHLDQLHFAGILSGCAAERSCVNGSVTREQMAAFLHRTTYATPIGPAGFAEMVAHPTPITVKFIGPARFKGVAFNGSGTTATQFDAMGTIPALNVRADRTGLINGVRYAHLVDGPMATAWVKVSDALTTALGRAPAPPRCSYQDILTSRRAYDQFATTLLDTIYMLPSSYAPGDRVGTGSLGLNAGYSVRSVIAADLTAMARDARAAGAPLQVVSAYRSYSQQAATFQHWVEVSGYEQALLTSARAGHSEHQLGTTLDVTSLGGRPPWEYADWGATTAGKWMVANAWRYGFVMSYHRGETSATCYSYEPWHYRYVGRPTAAAVQTSGMTLREAIWAAHGP